MSEQIWIPEPGKLIVRHALGNGELMVVLGYREVPREPKRDHYRELARMTNFLASAWPSGWTEAPGPTEYALSESRYVMRRLAADADIRAFFHLWDDVETSPVEWLEEVIRTELGLLQSEKDRLSRIVAEYQRALAL